MLGIIYAPRFARRFRHLPEALQEEAAEKIRLFRDKKNHAQLRVHKLHGEFKGCFSFSVNYRTRIVFEYVSKKEAALLAIGDHDVYE